MNPPEVGLGFLVAEVSRLTREQFNVVAHEIGLTLAQARAMAYLARNEGISQVELSALLEVQPITLLRQIDRLEAAGLVERRPHPKDRRAQRLYLTPRSRATLDNIWAFGREIQERAFTGLDEKARAQLLESLTIVKRNLSELPQQSKPASPPARRRRRAGR
jgi:MarR family transcriptional regulator, transcriptional regulator for hemolysin